MKCRRKPLEFEYVKFEDTAECFIKLQELGIDPVVIDYHLPENPTIEVNTPFGEEDVEVGEYIIKYAEYDNPKIRFYEVVTPEVFEAEYEIV